MKELLRQLCKVFPGIIAPIIFGIWIRYFHLLKANYWSIAVWGFWYVVVYGISMWFVFNESEKAMAKSIISKLTSHVKTNK